MEMKKSIVEEGSNSGANFIYYELKEWCYHRVLGVIKRNLKREEVMVSTNRKKGMRGVTRKTRSRCNLNSVLRPIKLIGGAALRFHWLCVGWNGGRAREEGAV